MGLESDLDDPIDRILERDAPTRRRDDSRRLPVREELGPIAVPAEIDFMPVLPKTRSGKIMRRLLKANELGIDPGDITTLEE